MRAVIPSWPWGTADWRPAAVDRTPLRFVLDYQPQSSLAFLLVVGHPAWGPDIKPRLLPEATVSLLIRSWYNPKAFDLPEVIVSLLQNALELIGTPSGALVYHLVTLFAIQLILGVAIGHWQRQRDEVAARLLTMSVGIFLARAVLMIVALVGRVGLTSSDVVVPPLERFLHLTTVALAVWAFLPLAREYPRAGTAVLLSVGLLAAGTYGAFATLWPGAEAAGIAYNSYWQESVWGLSTAAALGLAFIASIAWRGEDTGWLACLLALWLAGHVLQLTAPVADANTPGWVRLADLAALPLLAGLVYRRALAHVSPAPGDSEEMTLGAVGVLRAVQRIAAGEALEPALELAAFSVGRAVGADMVAFGLSTPGPDEAIRIVALHPTTSAMLEGREPTVSVSNHHLLATAFENRRVEWAGGDRQASGVMRLYHHLGFDVAGPLLVQPLATEDEVVGLLLVGNPTSGRKWREREREMLQTLAAPLAFAIARGPLLEGASERELEKARLEARRMAQRAEQLEARLQQQRQTNEELVTRARLRDKETASEKEMSAALALWEDEVRELAVARDTLKSQLQHWREKAESLAEAKAGLEAQLKNLSPATGHRVVDRFDGLLLSDTTGRIILASADVEHLLGKAPAQLMETRLESLFDETAWKSAVNRLLSGSGGPGDATAVTVTVPEGLARARLSLLAGAEHGSGWLAALLQRAVEPAESVSEPLDLTSIVEDTLGRLSSSVEEKELAVQADLADELPPVYADPDRLHQVVHTLISNAVLASRPGTTIDILARVEEHEDPTEGPPPHLLVSVGDTGGGIAAEDQPYVFQRFCGASNPLVEGLGEPGSGLHVAKALIEADGGRIWVESEMDVGSTFSFILPLPPPEGLLEPGPPPSVSKVEP